MMNVNEWIRKIESHFNRSLNDFAVESDRNDSFPEALVDYIMRDQSYRELVQNIDRYENQCKFNEVIFRVSYDFAGLASILLTQTINGIYPMLRFGTDEQQDKYLSKLVRGEVLSGLAYSEHGHSTHLATLETKAFQTTEGWVINGHKHQVSNGKESTQFYVLADVESGGTLHKALFILDRYLPGLTVSETIEKIGIRGMSLTELHLENVHVTDNCMLAGSLQGDRQCKDIVRVLKMAIVAQALGLSRSTIDKGIAYLSIDRKIGKRLIEMENIQEKLAVLDAKYDIYMCYYKQVFSDLSRNEEDVAKLKLLCSDFAQEASDTIISMTGGFGYLKQNDMDRIGRDATATSLYGGTNQSQAKTIAQKWL